MLYHSNVILLLCLFIFGLATRYRKFLIVLFLSLVCLNIYKYIYLCRFQCYREFYKPVSSIIPRIKPGDLISTAHPKGTSLFQVLTIFRVLLSDFYIHTAVAIEYQGEIWMLHSYPESIYNSAIITRPTKKYLFNSNGWVLYMEPLSQFLESEKKEEAVFRVSHTNKHISFRPEVIDTLKRQFDSRTFPQTMHCCEFIGKFLAINGIVENRTGAPDSVYYSPLFLLKQAETIEYISLTEC